MKQALKRVVDAAAIPKDALARSIFKAAPRGPRGPADSVERVLILPSQAPGSLGDEALMEGVLTEVRRRSGTPMIVEYDGDGWGKAKGVESVDMTDYFHLSQRVSLTAWRSVSNFLETLERVDRLVMIGADVIDGYYNSARTVQRLTLAHIAANAGIPTSIVSFSFNAEPTPRALRALRALPANVDFVAREPISRARIEQTLRRSCRLGADIAFLMDSDRTSAKVVQVSEWIHEQRAEGRTIVGFNTNAQPFLAIGSTAPGEMVEVHGATVSRLVAHGGCACIFISHDWRGELPEQQIAEMVRDRVPDALRPHTLIVDGPHSAMEAKGICAELDFLVTGRMHLSIGALTHAVPTAFLPYQGKFEGLTEHLGLEDLVLDTQRALLEESLTDQVVPLLERRSELREVIAERMPKILELSRSNLA